MPDAFKPSAGRREKTGHRADPGGNGRHHCGDTKHGACEKGNRVHRSGSEQDQLLENRRPYADLKDEIAKLEKKAKSEDTAQKVVIGGMLLSLARKNKDIAKMTLAWIDENVTRKNDLDRLKPIIAELNEFLDPNPAVIQDEQKENPKGDVGAVGVQSEQQQTNFFNDATTNF